MVLPLSLASDGHSGYRHARSSEMAFLHPIEPEFNVSNSTKSPNFVLSSNGLPQQCWCTGDCEDL